ncbi:MAG TPA: methyltransferase domain-containing protein [Bacillota bacterium]|nr:methyltransferase domain-containing protein [Bacillota bacterium]
MKNEFKVEPQIESEIQAHYAGLSSQDCTLSCGNNLDFINLKPGECFLDLGCGKGLETIAAAKLVGPSGLAIGLDLTPEMITAAIGNARSQNLGQLQFMIGDIEELLFENESFDAVISNCVINHARDKNRVYQEIYRVVRPGGRFVISDAVTKLPLPERIKNQPEQWAACFGGAVTEWEYLQSIKRAGFDPIEILKRREYLKNGYDFISLTIRAYKNIQGR